MFPSVSSALKADARRHVRRSFFARQLFALQVPAPICLFPGCPCQEEHAEKVDRCYRDLLVLEAKGWVN